jgi:hypothetical protein
MTMRREQLYRLLPAIYQTLDQVALPEDQKGPLRELLSVIGEQVNLLEDDLKRWCVNWFIETCEDWVVPYIGDLVGYQSAAKELDTIALSRRKGTLALLEELPRRIVGWPARAVEYRNLVSGVRDRVHELSASAAQQHGERARSRFPRVLGHRL